jgi:hypothetical protein
MCTTRQARGFITDKKGFGYAPRRHIQWTKNINKWNHTHTPISLFEKNDRVDRDDPYRPLIMGVRTSLLGKTIVLPAATTSVRYRRLAMYRAFFSKRENEEPDCRKTRQTSLQSIIPKDVMTSLWSLLTSNHRKTCEQFSTGFGKIKRCLYMSILWNFHRKNWWDIENFALMHKFLPE